MKNKIITIIFFSFIFQLKAQNEKFQINGAARSYLFSNEIKIDKSLDSITPRKSNFGHNLFDAGISVFPNKQAEVIGMFRIRNELGGFWGGGVTFNVRQLTLKGVASNIVRYEIGDIDLKMTPYTLYNTQEEGIVNEGDIFQIRRKVLHYDLFYQENQWRMQGAKVDFNILTNSTFDKITFKGYLTRQRATDGLSLPERLYGGGSIDFINSPKLNFKLNSSNMFDLTRTLINDSTKFTNSVTTSSFNYNLMSQENTVIKVFGETGISYTSYINYINNDAPKEMSEWFYDIASLTHFKKKNLQLEFGVKDIGKDFRSPGAQTKRIDYSKSPGLYQQFTNDYIGREISFSDIIDGNAEASFKISETLMAYNVAYNNTNPYGDATPNRRGVYLNIEQSDSGEIKKRYIECSLLQESVGTGTLKRRNFILSKIGADLTLNKIFKIKNQLKINLGIQNEYTFRKGEDYEKIALFSNFMDAGLSYELIENLNLLLGTKLWLANGNEKYIVRDEFNNIIDFEAIEINFSEMVFASGISYNFSQKNAITLQYQNFELKNNIINAIDYGISQFIILYSLYF